MSFSIANRTLLRAMLAGAVVLTGAACSRSDRAKSGPDNTAAVASDTSSSAQSAPSAPSNAPRAQTAPPSGTDAAGYRSMERDTMTPPNQHSDSARATADTSVSQASPVTSDSATTESASSSASAEVTTANADTSSIADTASVSASADVADTAAAGYAEMARDTSTVAEQADTAAANGEVALKTTVDTSAEANADVSAESGAADTTGNAGRIRPPEDSTEILGNVTTDEAADETADEQVVKPEDRATVATPEIPKDEVGAAAIGGEVTGAEAVALMTREGLRCAVVDPEVNQEVRWDMSSTPVSLNPCGMGSMIPSRIWTAGQRGSGTAGQ